MDVRRQHINLQCTGKCTSERDREQVALRGGHAFTIAMIVATHGIHSFSIVLMGKALKHTVVFLLATCTCLDLPRHSGQTKYCNTVNRGMVGKEQAEKNMSETLRFEKEVHGLMYVCFCI